ncbi:MAG: S49 family peptidase [Pseudomonadota bacterium]
MSAFTGEWAINPSAVDQLHSLMANSDLSSVDAARNTNGIGYKFQGSTGCIDIVGPIFRHENLWTRLGYAVSLEDVLGELAAIARDPAMDSVVLNIDSPGGQANGINEAAQMIRSVASKKPVTAYVGGMAASAAYWLASAADRIVVDETAFLGSIGVVLTLIASREDPRRVEVVSSVSPNKRLDPRSEEGLASAKNLVDGLARVFVDSVAKYRSVSSDLVINDFGRGDVRMGRKAVEVGMADEIGSFNRVLSESASQRRRSVFDAASSQAQSVETGSSTPVHTLEQGAHVAEQEWNANTNDCQSNFSSKENFIAVRKRELVDETREAAANRPLNVIEAARRAEEEWNSNFQDCHSEFSEKENYLAVRKYELSRGLY